MIRTGYSFRTAVGHLPDVISRIKEIGWECAPIADRNSTFAFTQWTKLAATQRPIYGVELAVTPALGATKPIFDYWVFLAIENLLPLHNLIELATSNPGREPSLTYAQALAADGVIKISGEAVQLNLLTPSDTFYIGLSPATPRGIIRTAPQDRLIATQRNRYPRAEDKEFYRVTISRRLGKKMYAADTQTYPQHILSDEEWSRVVGNFPTAIDNRERVFNLCRAQLKKASLKVVDKPQTLHEMCIDGAKKLNVNLDNPIYRTRLQKELKLIHEKDFADYFYIIADMMAWAREHMVVGPARGSSCGSLVCYLLGITSIDPIPFKLLFERFIDTTRTDLPDIDLDFSDQRRQDLFDYVEKKYGKHHVARLGTVGTFQPRSALKQAGISLRVPQWKLDKVSDNIIVRSSGDARAQQQLEDTLKDTDAGRVILKDHPEIMIATKMEGHPTYASQHAAGIIITEEPIKNFVAIDGRTKSAMCDKYDAESLNLLKIDALGLTQLSIFERTLQLIGKPDKAGYLEQLPLDDPKAFDVLNKQHFAGVFQFMGSALQSLSKGIKIDCLEDLIAITALARPGPLATGGANSWVKRRAGIEPVSYPHPLLEPYLRDTLGIVIYQEQTMQIGREIGDLTWEQVTLLRKAMSRSLGEEYFNQFGDPWKSAAKKKGLPEDVANRFWKDLCSFGSWAFNRSHAVAYGLVSYWCCYLKAHYPVEFAAATLDAESDPARQISLLRELNEEGIKYKAIDPELSGDKWTPAGGNLLIGPLTNVKGLGPVTMLQIMEARKNGGLPPKLEKRLLEARTPIDTLWPVSDKIKALHPNLKFSLPVSKVKEVQCGVTGEVIITACVRRIVPRDANEIVNIAKRNGRKLTVPNTKYLNLFFQDDTDEIFCMIDYADFPRFGEDIIERGRAEKALYAVKGTVPRNFRMIKISNIKYLGDLDAQDPQQPAAE